MLANIRKDELDVMVNISRIDPQTLDDLPNAVVISPTSCQLKTAFVMGVKIYLPFCHRCCGCKHLVGNGYDGLPPVIISLPFKILLFVLMDGCNLIDSDGIFKFLWNTKSFTEQMKTLVKQGKHYTYVGHK